MSSAKTVIVTGASSGLGLAIAKAYLDLGFNVVGNARTLARLQEAAERVRTHPDVDLAAVAAEFGYADQAHLAHDFRRVLGITPSSYRRDL